MVLDESGAERLNGVGDALYNSRLTDTTIKVSVPYINDHEIKALTGFWKEQGTNIYDKEFIDKDESVNTSFEGDADDQMYEEVVKFAKETGRISASIIQRRFRFGYNRAARMMDLLEARGVVGPQNGSKPREVLIKLENNGEDK